MHYQSLAISDPLELSFGLPPKPVTFWPFLPEVDLILSEFADNGGKGVYFALPDPP